MATKCDIGSSVASEGLCSGEGTLLELFEEFCAKQRKNEGLKKFGKNLPAQMKVLSELVNDFSGLYRRGVIAAMTDSTTSVYIESYLLAVKNAFEGESGRSDITITAFCPKKGEMSEDEYNVYAIGYHSAIALFNSTIDSLLITLDLGN